VDVRFYASFMYFGTDSCRLFSDIDHTNSSSNSNSDGFFFLFDLDNFKEMLFFPLRSSVSTFYLFKRINLILLIGRRFILSYRTLIVANFISRLLKRAVLL
jgi:hypothetical protein